MNIAILISIILVIINQFIAQLIGILAVGIYTFSLSYILLNTINNYSPLRVSKEAEDIGLNIAEHDSSSDQIDLLKIMQYLFLALLHQYFQD